MFSSTNTWCQVWFKPACSVATASVLSFLLVVWASPVIAQTETVVPNDFEIGADKATIHEAKEAQMESTAADKDQVQTPSAPSETTDQIKNETKAEHTSAVKAESKSDTPTIQPAEIKVVTPMAEGHIETTVAPTVETTVAPPNTTPVEEPKTVEIKAVEPQTVTTETTVECNQRAPLPGSNDENSIATPNNISADNLGDAKQQSLPQKVNEAAISAIPTIVQNNYPELPLCIADAKIRLQQLKTMAAGSRPQDAIESVNQFLRWMADMVDAHNRISAVFAKNDATKPQSLAEKQTANKFTNMRQQGQLLKANLLIDAHRYPEALAPLVEIVISSPHEITGRTAYKRLQDLGFSEAIEAATAPPAVEELAVQAPLATTKAPRQIAAKIKNSSRHASIGSASHRSKHPTLVSRK